MSPNIQTFYAEKGGTLRQKEKSWCNFITPLNGFLITAAPFFRSNFAALGKKLFCLRSMPRWGDNESIPIFTVKRWAEDLSNFDQGFQAQPCHSNCKSNFVVGLKGVCDSEGVDGCEALRAITIWWVSPYLISLPIIATLLTIVEECIIGSFVWNFLTPEPAMNQIFV